MLILGLLPGPNEVRTDKINHYLSPIVDELLEFWAGAELQKMADYPNGKQFEWQLFAVVVIYQQQGNYAATYHHWPLVIDVIR